MLHPRSGELVAVRAQGCFINRTDVGNAERQVPSLEFYHAERKSHGSLIKGIYGAVDLVSGRGVEVKYQPEGRVASAQHAHPVTVDGRRLDLRQLGRGRGLLQHQRQRLALCPCAGNCFAVGAHGSGVGAVDRRHFKAERSIRLSAHCFPGFRSRLAMGCRAWRSASRRAQLSDEVPAAKTLLRRPKSRASRRRGFARWEPGPMRAVHKMQSQVSRSSKTIFLDS